MSPMGLQNSHFHFNLLLRCIHVFVFHVSIHILVFIVTFECYFFMGSDKSFALVSWFLFVAQTVVLFSINFLC